MYTDVRGGVYGCVGCAYGYVGVYMAVGVYTGVCVCDVHGCVGCARVYTEVWGVHGCVGCTRVCGVYMGVWGVHGDVGCIGGVR